MSLRGEVKKRRMRSRRELLQAKMASGEIVNKLRAYLAVCHSGETGEETALTVEGTFVCIGQVPENTAFANVVTLNDYGYVTAGENCLPESTLPGIFVAGDCRTKSIRQVTTATADGAVAALAACRYLDTL